MQVTPIGVAALLRNLHLEPLKAIQERVWLKIGEIKISNLKTPPIKRWGFSFGNKQTLDKIKKVCIVVQ